MHPFIQGLIGAAIAVTTLALLAQFAEPKNEYEYKCFERQVYYKQHKDQFWYKTGRECM